VNYSINQKGDIHLEGSVESILCGSCGNILGKRNDNSVLLYTKINLISMDEKKILAKCGQCKVFADVSRPGSRKVMV
jgi:hypothetical protein